MGTYAEITNRYAALRKLGPFNGMQIVPTFEDAELLTHPASDSDEAAAGPLAYHNGHLIPAGFETVNLFVQGAQVDQNDFNDYTKAITEDGFYISPDGKQYNGKFLGGKVVSLNSGTYLNSQIGAFIDQLVQQGAIPEATNSRNFCLILSPGVNVQFDGTNEACCTNFCGFHTHSAAGTYYSVICDSTCVGCHGNFLPAEGRMMVQSHEIGEWVSDPDGTGWYNDKTGAENGDQCAWNRIPWGPKGKGWVVQPLWVNGSMCSNIPAYQGGTPVPPPNAKWSPRAGLPLSAVMMDLLANPVDIEVSRALGELLQFAFVNGFGSGAGAEFAGLLSWWQQNPNFPAGGIFDPAPNGAGWGAWLDNNKLA